MELTINIQASELANAIQSLAKALEINTQGNLSAKNALATTITVLADVLESNGKGVTAEQVTGAPAQIAPAPVPMPAQTPPAQYFPQVPQGQGSVPMAAPMAAPIPTAPMAPAPAPVPAAAPVMPQQPMAVPTAQQTYTMDQLAVAATQLVDAGRRNELVGLLNAFGVQALTALPKEQYGNFATQLRSMGAKI